MPWNSLSDMAHPWLMPQKRLQHMSISSLDALKHPLKYPLSSKSTLKLPPKYPHLLTQCHKTAYQISSYPQAPPQNCLLNITPWVSSNSPHLITRRLKATSHLTSQPQAPPYNVPSTDPHILTWRLKTAFQISFSQPLETAIQRHRSAPVFSQFYFQKTCCRLRRCARKTNYWLPCS